MTIRKYNIFNPATRWYTRQGCLVCGSNVGPCIDLGVTDRIDGQIALCVQHAKEAGRLAGLLDDGVVEEAKQKKAEAERMFQAVTEESAKVAQERQTIEGLLARLQVLPEPTSTTAAIEEPATTTKAKK